MSDASATSPAQAHARDRNGRRATAGAPAVGRAAAVLRLLAASPEPMGVNAIARETGMVPSTCLNILRALVAESLVRLNPATKRYALDAGILSLANRLLRQDDFSSRVVPQLDSMASRFGVTGVAVRLIGMRHQVVLALSQANVLFRLQVDIGSHFPALITASGYCCAAFGGHPKSEMRKAFATLNWDEAPDFDSWWAQVEATREVGYGVDAGHYIRGVTIIAAPVRAEGDELSHAITAVGLSAQLDPSRCDAIGAALTTAARRLSRRTQ